MRIYLNLPLNVLAGQINVDWIKAERRQKVAEVLWNVKQLQKEEFQNVYSGNSVEIKSPL